MYARLSYFNKSTKIDNCTLKYFIETVKKTMDRIRKEEEGIGEMY